MLARLLLRLFGLRRLLLLFHVVLLLSLRVGAGISVSGVDVAGSDIFNTAQISTGIGPKNASRHSICCYISVVYTPFAVDLLWTLALLFSLLSLHKSSLISNW